MCRRSAEWCTEVWLLQQVPEWPWQQEPGGGLSSSFGPSEIFLFLVLVKATVTVSLFTMLPLALEDAVV